MPASTLAELLVGLTETQKADRKAEALSSIANTGTYKVGNKTVTAAKLVGYSYVTNGVTITLVSASYDAATGVLWTTVTASDSRGALPVDDRYGFRNPPILLRTGPTTTSENIATAARTMLYEAVITYARNHGWTPA